jgi:hypothetical protein
LALAGRFEKAASPSEEVSKEVPGPWEALPSVLAARNSRYFVLIGSVKISSPWFEIAFGLYLAQAVTFLSMVLFKT